MRQADIRRDFPPIDKRIIKLKHILRKQIAWYHENKDDPGLIYDDMCCQFHDLLRGDFVDIIETLISTEENANN